MSARDLLSRLVAIDSVSARSNLAVIELLEGELRTAGFSTRRQPVGPDKANLIAHKGPTGPGGLALVGHTDTVPYDPAWTEALTLTERDGKLYGRGACDTKAFIACALSAAARPGPALAAPLWLLFTADEEVGCLGAKQLEQLDDLRPQYAIVGEPTELRPIRGGKGYCLAEIVIVGEEGHSAYPDRGASALQGARLFLDELDKLQDVLRQEQQEGFSPSFTTLNVGVLQAGKAKNIIAGEARFTLEWRPVPLQATARVRAALSLIAARVHRRFPRLGVQVQVQREESGYATPADSVLVRFLEAQSGFSAGTVPFGTEAPSLIALGAQSVVFGPGDIRVAHQTGEFVPLSDLARGVEILAEAIGSFCGPAPS